MNVIKTTIKHHEFSDMFVEYVKQLYNAGYEHVDCNAFETLMDAQIEHRRRHGNHCERFFFVHELLTITEVITHSLNDHELPIPSGPYADQFTAHLDDYLTQEITKRLLGKLIGTIELPLPSEN